MTQLVDRSGLEKVLHATFPGFRDMTRADQLELQRRHVRVLQSAVQMMKERRKPQATARKRIAELKKAIETVHTARQSLNRSVPLIIGAGEPERGAGRAVERGYKRWHAFDQAIQDALGWTGETLDKLDKPDSRRQAPPGFDLLIEQLANAFALYRQPNGKAIKWHASKRDRFMSYASEVIGCARDYPKVSDDDIRNAVRRLGLSKRDGIWAGRSEQANTDDS
jgi:hypothetical protein